MHGPGREPSAAGALSEAALPGPVPRFEIPGWRARFGVVAGITGRAAGDGPDFDLGLGTSSPVGATFGRWRTFRAAEPACGYIVTGYQVHGIEVAEAGPGEGWLIRDGIDGWVTRTTGTLLTVTVADCIPVYLVAPGRGVGLLHAGWRGTAGGMLARGVDRLAALTGAAGDEIIMHGGVGICGSCYDVGAEVMHGCGLPAEGPGPWHLDLRERLREEARRLGLTDITLSTWCSAHHRDRFFSHRASGGSDGRMVAYLGMPAPETGAGG